jgi:hypothetical protein
MVFILLSFVNFPPALHPHPILSNPAFPFFLQLELPGALTGFQGQKIAH